MWARFEQEKLELAVLYSQFNELKEKLQPCKGNISDRQQTAATNSEVKNKIDPLRKEFNDYWKEYICNSKYLEEQVLKHLSLDQTREQCIGKMSDLRDFYRNSLETAKELRFEKFAGIPAYNKEVLILNNHIETIRMHIETLDKQIHRHKQEEHREKRSVCMQS